MPTIDRSSRNQSGGGSTETDRELRSASQQCQLWRAVLLQAARDIASGDQARRSEVERWILTTDFHAVCRGAQVDATPTGQMLLGLRLIEPERVELILLQVKAVLG